MKKSLTKALILGVFWWQNCNKWVPFLEKSLHVGTYFCKQKLPLNMGGLELLVHIPDQSKSEYPLGLQRGSLGINKTHC